MHPELRDELLLMQAADLQLRSRLAEQRALFGGYNEEMAALHQRQARRLRQILDAHGWPGRPLVGDDGCSAAWLVLQHSIIDPALMRQALPLLETAVRREEAPAAQLAYLTDRIRTLQGELQVYGTQHDWDDSGQMSPLPMEDSPGVDSRRAALGMGPLAAHTARLRERAIQEGEERPADLAKYRQEGQEWARSMGWRS